MGSASAGCTVPMATEAARLGLGVSFSTKWEPRRCANRSVTNSRYGFSRGGSAALYTSMRHFQDLYGSTGTRIAAHLAFYPACNIEFVEELDIADAPIREFHGAADNWTLAAPCRDYIARRKSAGKDAALTEYPGASHAVDAPDTPPGYVVDGDRSRDCQRREEEERSSMRRLARPLPTMTLAWNSVRPWI